MGDCAREMLPTLFNCLPSCQAVANCQNTHTQHTHPGDPGIGFGHEFRGGCEPEEEVPWRCKAKKETWYICAQRVCLLERFTLRLQSQRRRRTAGASATGARSERDGEYTHFNLTEKANEGKCDKFWSKALRPADTR